MPRWRQRTGLGGILSHPWSDWPNSSTPENTLMDPRHLSDDFRDFLICLNEAGVEYLVIGGHAVAYHGHVRPTRDMDIWIAVSPENARRAVEALTKFFGAKLSGLSEDWFLDRANVTRFGAVPNLIEILPRVSGVEFDEAYGRRVVAEIDGQRAHIIALADLITNKRASGRHKDLADIEGLPNP